MDVVGGVTMGRLQVRTWDWLVRTRKSIPGREQEDLNECFGATIVVTSIKANGDVEGVVFPGDPHDSQDLNDRGGQFVLIRAENLIADFFTSDPRLRLRAWYAPTEAA